MSTEPEFRTVRKPAGDVWGRAALHCVTHTHTSRWAISGQISVIRHQSGPMGHSPWAVMSLQFSGSCVTSSIFGSLQRYMKGVKEVTTAVCVFQPDFTSACSSDKILNHHDICYYQRTTRGWFLQMQLIISVDQIDQYRLSLALTAEVTWLSWHPGVILLSCSQSWKSLSRFQINWCIPVDKEPLIV